MKQGPALLFLLLGLACAPPRTAAPPRNTFVLMPDRDGHVGSATVTNAQGSATLDQAGQSVTVAGLGAPGQPRILTPTEIETAFGAALAAEPPKSFECRLQFRTGSSDLEPGAVAALAEVVNEIRRRDSRDISVTGHTDTTGDPDLNMRLSLDRARKVRDFLLLSGVPPEYVNVAYHGKGNPLVPTGDNVDEPRNRRVEVTVR